MTILLYGDWLRQTEFSMSIFNALGNSVRTIDQDNVGEIVYDPGIHPRRAQG